MSKFVKYIGERVLRVINRKVPKARFFILSDDKFLKGRHYLIRSTDITAVTYIHTYIHIMRVLKSVSP